MLVQLGAPVDMPLSITISDAGSSQARRRCDGASGSLGPFDLALDQLFEDGEEAPQVLVVVRNHHLAHDPRRQGVEQTIRGAFIAAQDYLTAASSSIQFLSFATGAVTPVATTEKYATHGLAVSPDRRWIVYTQYDQVNSDLMLVENFR